MTTTTEPDVRDITEALFRGKLRALNPTRDDDLNGTTRYRLADGVVATVRNYLVDRRAQPCYTYAGDAQMLAAHALAAPPATLTVPDVPDEPATPPAAGHPLTAAERAELAALDAAAASIAEAGDCCVIRTSVHRVDGRIRSVELRHEPDCPGLHAHTEPERHAVPPPARLRRQLRARRHQRRGHGRATIGVPR